MESKIKPLIVGIDPGTTTAYACLDLSSEIVAIGSAKELSLGKLIADVSEIGLPLIVASDKALTPSFVRDFAAKTGARLIYPKADLLVKEKLEIVKTTREPGYINSHEMDALASALFAYRKLHPLIKKLNYFIKKHEKENIANEIARLVIVKGIPISLASGYIEKQKERKQTITPKHEDTNRDESLALNLAKRNALLSDEIMLLSSQISSLHQKMSALEKALIQKDSKIENKVHKDRISYGLEFKEKIISKLNLEVREKGEEIRSLQAEIGSLYAFVEKVDMYIMVKSLDNLGANALNQIKVKKGDIIFVKNASEFSKNTLEKMSGIIIIASNPSSEVKRRFTVIDAKKLELIRPTKSSPFYFAKKAEFAELLDEHGILDRVISDYKAEKQK